MRRTEQHDPQAVSRCRCLFSRVTHGHRPRRVVRAARGRHRPRQNRLAMDLSITPAGQERPLPPCRRPFRPRCGGHARPPGELREAVQTGQDPTLQARRRRSTAARARRAAAQRRGTSRAVARCSPQDPTFTWPPDWSSRCSLAQGPARAKYAPSGGHDTCTQRTVENCTDTHAHTHTHTHTHTPSNVWGGVQPPHSRFALLGPTHCTQSHRTPEGCLQRNGGRARGSGAG